MSIVDVNKLTKIIADVNKYRKKILYLCYKYAINKAYFYANKFFLLINFYSIVQIERQIIKINSINNKRMFLQCL